MKTDAINRALELRKTLVKGDQVMVANFPGTLQEKDTTKVIDTMTNVSTGDLIFRAKYNVKDINPKAAKDYCLLPKDVKTMPPAEIEEIVKRAEFDFPLWYKYDEGFDIRKVLDYNTPFIFQVAGCNFHAGSETDGCWYCFVDYFLNDGDWATGHKSWLRPVEAVDSMIDARKKL